MNGQILVINSRREAFSCQQAAFVRADRRRAQKRMGDASRPRRRCVRPATVVVGQEALESSDGARQDGADIFLAHSRSTLMNASIETIVTAFCALTFVQSVNAATHSEGMTAGRSVVRYGDLNLNIERDAKKMLRRIDEAAVAACGGWHPFGLRDGLIQKDFQKCRADAVAGAVLDLDAPLVTRIYTGANASDKAS
jgi:UrcA family protein